MPDLSVELHDRGLERVVGRNLDVDFEDPALVASVFGPEDGALPVLEIVAHDLGRNDLLSRLGSE